MVVVGLRSVQLSFFVNKRSWVNANVSGAVMVAVVYWSAQFYSDYPRGRGFSTELPRLLFLKKNMSILRVTVLRKLVDNWRAPLVRSLVPHKKVYGAPLLL